MHKAMFAMVVAAALASPAATGAKRPFDVAAVEQAARTLPRLHSLLVSRGGELVFER